MVHIMQMLRFDVICIKINKNGVTILVAALCDFLIEGRVLRSGHVPGHSEHIGSFIALHNPSEEYCRSPYSDMRAAILIMSGLFREQYNWVTWLTKCYHIQVICVKKYLKVKIQNLSLTFMVRTNWVRNLHTDRQAMAALSPCKQKYPNGLNEALIYAKIECGIFTLIWK